MLIWTLYPVRFNDYLFTLRLLKSFFGKEQNEEESFKRQMAKPKNEW